ncbi:26S proteasome non-ATPase regulatory subunit 2-like [Misgurnus anguillicaudatus]|uniref:26S proteasome non-ATPase regulatory subunit 2-like n=1 Tax=Misgurnus anguillicaudatus TaxID=75329 RepID=UPI003CCFA543
MLVERLGKKDTSLYRPALEELRRQIRSSTTSMTSVPKPLKFLRPHYAKLKEIYQNMSAGENKHFCADVVSVLAMAMSESVSNIVCWALRRSWHHGAMNTSGISRERLRRNGRRLRKVIKRVSHRNRCGPEDSGPRKGEC